MPSPEPWVRGADPGKDEVVRPAALEWSQDRRTLRLLGSWTTPALGGLADLAVVESPPVGPVTIDATELRGLDTAGALLLHRLRERLEAQGRAPRILGLDERRADLLELVAARVEPPPAGLAGSEVRQAGVLERLGHATLDWLGEGLAMLSFGGAAALAFMRGLASPRRVRWRQVLRVVEQDGVLALPVLGMLAFLLGVVIAYQSGVQLRVYGGNLYVVDLVTITVLRELGPMMTAIVVAGRSGSAYAAQIGTMQVTEEVDALRSIGVAPLDLLVLPKILGLAIALPLLTVFANVAAVVGAMVMSALMLDLSPEVFMRRIPEAVTISSLMTGLAKVPVFAVAIALVGCYQGFQVRGGADSVGRHTTTSVVQAIVLVLMLDAAFSVIYSWMGI
ncbi:MAG: MlaE family ABC transporter permease [Bdellovibrio bacteriovorus]